METGRKEETKEQEIDIKQDGLKEGKVEESRKEKEQGINKGEKGEWILLDWFQSAEHLLFIWVFLLKERNCLLRQSVWLWSNIGS